MFTAYFKGAPVTGSFVYDGAPLGTIISFMGTKAPDGYLACDGKTYAISAYPSLAAFFQEQFGSAAYFGGDGTSTFAVPDLRNLFLRGYHGEAEEQLSGEIGAEQAATKHVTVYPSEYSNYIYAAVDLNIGGSFIENQDTVEERNSLVMAPVDTSKTQTGSIIPPHYTARPVNMAVLYCIRAATGLS